MDQGAGTTGISPSGHRRASIPTGRSSSPRSLESTLPRGGGGGAVGLGNALWDQGEDLRTRCRSSARLAPTSPGLPHPEGGSPALSGFGGISAFFPGRLGPSRRPCSRRLCQERGRSRAAGGPDGRAAPEPGHFLRLSKRALSFLPNI